MIRRRMIEADNGIKEDLMLKRLTDTMTEYDSEEVTSVISYGFSYQKNLEKVSLPNCTILGDGAFFGCNKLSEIHFPKLVTVLNNAFRNCTALTEFITTGAFNSRLDRSTFEGCTNLAKADFYHINTLGISGYALACQNLTTLIIRNTDFVPTIEGTTFGTAATAMNTGEGRIYVPGEMVDAYKQAANWIKYADQILSIDELEE